MPPLTAAELDSLFAAIAARRPEHGLPGEFYHSPLIYRADVARVWRRGWLVAGHGCEIPQPGDYFTFEADDDSLIVVRDDDGHVYALHNVCRHRGAELCDRGAGRVGRFVCAYHQWTYARDGALMACRGMHEEGVHKNELGLVTAHARELAGLIFVSLADEPPDFAPAAAMLEPMLRPQGLDRAKVAHVVDYEVAANWKVVWENNRECYHCNVNHPQYIQANFDHINEDDLRPEIQQRMEQAVAHSEQKWAARGLSVSHRSTGMAVFPDAEQNLWYSANRTALAEGFVTESMDGKRIAPLMGDYDDVDVGTLRVRTVPNFWNHSSCDHAVSTRLSPAGPGRTNIRVVWLVDQDAVEGRDYRVDELLPFWRLTSEQDWQLCERVQRGVSSSRYVPGPFSRHKEYNVDRFTRWYLKQLAVE